jgi:hypothetical protein
LRAVGLRLGNRSSHSTFRSGRERKTLNHRSLPRGAVREPACHHAKFLCRSILLTQGDFHKLGNRGIRYGSTPAPHTSKKSGPGFPRPDLIRRAVCIRPRCHRGFILSRSPPLSNYRPSRGRITSRGRAGCKIRRGIGHSEEDNDFPAWLALESATLFLHRLTAGWAQRFHWIIEMPETRMA